MRHLGVLLVIGAVFAPSQSTAAAETLRLICTYSDTIDAKGQRSAITGEKVITVAQIGAGRAVMKKEGLGAEFSGSISEDAIRGDTEYQIQGVTYKETLDINRISGSFTFTFGRQSDQGLVHHGKCRRASKLF